MHLLPFSTSLHNPLHIYTHLSIHFVYLYVHFPLLGMCQGFNTTPHVHPTSQIHHCCFSLNALALLKDSGPRISKVHFPEQSFCGSRRCWGSWVMAPWQEVACLAWSYFCRQGMCTNEGWSNFSHLPAICCLGSFQYFHPWCVLCASHFSFGGSRFLYFNKRSYSKVWKLWMNKKLEGCHHSPFFGANSKTFITLLRLSLK